MFKHEDDEYIWRSDDHIVELTTKELKDQKEFSFWMGFLTGMVSTTVASALGIALLFAH